jgi:hypothetical protein
MVHFFQNKWNNFVTNWEEKIFFWKMYLKNAVRQILPCFYRVWNENGNLNSNLSLITDSHPVCIHCEVVLHSINSFSFNPATLFQFILMPLSFVRFSFWKKKTLMQITFSFSNHCARFITSIYLLYTLNTVCCCLCCCLGAQYSLSISMVLKSWFPAVWRKKNVYEINFLSEKWWFLDLFRVCHPKYWTNEAFRFHNVIYNQRRFVKVFRRHKNHFINLFYLLIYLFFCCIRKSRI